MSSRCYQWTRISIGTIIVVNVEQILFIAGNCNKYAIAITSSDSSKS
ncbi:hypothetical protein [Pelosinus propionicus]|nr:hypothetical protein [Pelosinus propionicus]